MEITGRIIHVLPEQSGQGAKGPWKKQDFVLETESKYPKKVCFNVWGDKIDQFAIQLGEKYSVDVDVESREYNGKWYTEVKAFGARKLSGSAGNQVPPVMEEPPFLGNSDETDLPF